MNQDRISGLMDDEGDVESEWAVSGPLADFSEVGLGRVVAELRREVKRLHEKAKEQRDEMAMPRSAIDVALGQLGVVWKRLS